MKTVQKTGPKVCFTAYPFWASSTFPVPNKVSFRGGRLNLNAAIPLHQLGSHSARGRTPPG